MPTRLSSRRGPGPGTPGDVAVDVMDKVSVAVWRVDHTEVLKIDGVLDLAAAVRLRIALFRSLDEGTRTMVVDVTDLRRMDVGAVNVLLAVQRRLAGIGGSLTVPGARGPVLTVLERSGAAAQLSAYAVPDPPPDRSAGTALPVAAGPTGIRGQWGDEVNVLMGRLGELAVDDVTGRTMLRDRVIRRCLPIAERLARRFHRFGEPVADLNQVAALGLLKAIDRYDSNLGTDFPSYAVPTIVGELKRHFRDHGWSVRVPRRLQELRLEVNKARTELFHQLSRVPTTADLAAFLDVDEEAVVEAVVAASAYRSTSLFAPVGTEEEGPTLADRLGVEDGGFGSVENRMALRGLLAALPERERRIIALRFFDNETQSEIAQRLGISQMHVSRILSRTLLRLRRGMLTTD